MKKDNNKSNKKNKKWLDIYIIVVLTLILFLILFVIFPEITFKKIDNITNNLQIVSDKLKNNKNKLDNKIVENILENSDNNIETNNNLNQNNEFLEKDMEIKEGEPIVETINKIVFNKDDYTDYFINETVLLNHVNDNDIESYENNVFTTKGECQVYQTAIFVNNYEILEESEEIFLKIEYFYQNINFPNNIKHTADNFRLKILDNLIEPEENIELSIIKDFQSEVIELSFKVKDDISYTNLFLNDIILIYKDDYNYRQIFLNKK